MLFVWLLYLGNWSIASAVSGNNLVDLANVFDGHKVTFEGEVIGDVMIRRSHAWVNVNDGERAIGIWLTAAQAESIKYSGSYDRTGDRVRVTGTFHRACREHGGDLDIHADKLEIVVPGGQRAHPVDRNKLALSFGLLGLTLGLHLYVVWRKRLKAKKTLSS
ncbi:MAG: DNA-binding protein [Candidatus Saganbacteria bacterium]|nr:DNA-binding protein [Candidatus Saganbacteria bacterium]